MCPSYKLEAVSCNVTVLKSKEYRDVCRQGGKSQKSHCSYRHLKFGILIRERLLFACKEELNALPQRFLCPHVTHPAGLERPFLSCGNMELGVAKQTRTYRSQGL